jgi:hypothetical protein
MARTMVASLFPALALLVTSPNSRRRNSEVFDGGFIVVWLYWWNRQGEISRPAFVVAYGSSLNS